MKKAYNVRIDEMEGYCVVVFAENRNQARLLAMQEDNFDSSLRYIDLSLRRMPSADFFVLKYPDITSLDLENPEHARFLRKEGWWSVDCAYCEKCGLATFESIPESQLVCHNGSNICIECLEKEGSKK